jgi:pSer/pThr/pTyr-binding forkhead associated (FHA) protein
MAQQAPQPHIQQNGMSQPQRQMENPAVLYLTPMNGTFERKTITVPFYPDVLRIGRQTNNKTLPTPQNGYFDSKVLSRQHAEIWADRNGKIWIRDVKSSNGTFVNGQRLSQENKDSDPHELREQDMLELGIDIVSEDQKTVVHHKVAARVEHAGFYGSNNVLDLSFGDLDAAPGGLMGSALGQGLGQMRRTPSQSSLGSNGRMSVGSVSSGNMANMQQQQRQQHFWLTPVNMDKIIQKLNVSSFVILYPGPVLT